jgi:heme/copper-type cytochrome/quinol oxidase subunit 2
LLAPVYVFIFTEKLWIRMLAIILFIGGMLVLLSLLVSLRRAAAGSTHHPWNRWLWILPIAMVAFTALFFVGLIFDLSTLTDGRVRCPRGASDRLSDRSAFCR